MRFPFFKKTIKLEVNASVEPKKTQYGLSFGKNIDKDTFKILEKEHNEFYRKRVETNTEVLENKKKAAKVWMEYVIELFKDIPKNYINAVSIEEYQNNDLESHTHPEVFLKFTVDYGDSKEEKHYFVYAKEHEDSERSIMVLLDDVRKIKKKIQSLNKDKSNETL
jgi:hypothetical protein